ncbi:ras-related protein rab-10 [Anaeramoeba ignava]|uniref:Ras-related protein rab-10 n=1 Tax=Anaeramoeba ignava TaxID=1746090 RepID=A0A9Q0LUZ1_ANAIG|nr:ras-related protein rab-10 [Anaeramoeba ignava]
MEYKKPNPETSSHGLMFKIILIGSGSVGKTNILTKFCDDHFSLNTTSTIGVEYKTKVVEINDKKINLQIWDTAGQERFHSITKAFYRTSDGAFIVYDITSEESFNRLEYWIKELKEQEQTDAKFMILGNKFDLEKERIVPKEKGQKFAKENKVSFLETSAKDGTNIEKAFEILTKELLNLSQKKNNNTQTDSIVLNPKTHLNQPRKKKCC